MQLADAFNVAFISEYLKRGGVNGLVLQFVGIQRCFNDGKWFGCFCSGRKQIIINIAQAKAVQSRNGHTAVTFLIVVVSTKLKKRKWS